MADSKLSDLTAASALDGTELFYAVQGGADRKVTGAQIQALVANSTVTVPLTASQINHLFSAPQTIIAAPGLGKAIVCLGIQVASKVGTVPFDSENGDGGIYYDSPSGFDFALSLSNVTTSKIAFGTQSVLNFTAIENLPIVAAGTIEDNINGGAIATATVNAGGAGYAPGDTGSVNPQSTAIYVVDTVSGGAVATFHFSDGGYGNNVGVGKTTSVSTGGGDGNFKINTTSITPGNGSASVIVTYYILDLPT